MPCPGSIKAGIDCIEHGTGLTDDTIALMVEHGTALVPTLINIENFPGIADAAAKFPKYARHMRDLYQRCHPRIGAAREAGVPIYAGTDARSMKLADGRIAMRSTRSRCIGMSSDRGYWAPPVGTPASGWVDQVPEHGAPADLVCFTDDPRQGAAVVNNPDLVILRGVAF